MAVLIKGMGMPKSCGNCYMFSFLSDSCRITNHVTEEMNDKMFDRRFDDCPLIEVPEPQRLLGDLDKLNEEMHLLIKENMLSRDDARDLLETIADAPTIIPASEEG